MQVQSTAEASSTHLQAARRDADDAVREAELRARDLAREVADLQGRLQSERSAASAAAEAAAAQHDRSSEQLAAMARERDAAHEGRQKARDDLGMLRAHLVEIEDGAGLKESELVQRMASLEELVVLADERRSAAETTAAEGEARAAEAEKHAASAQRRCNEQAHALTSLQGLLEQMQLQACAAPRLLTVLAAVRPLRSARPTRPSRRAC
jgi:DNA repair exonuclease SbcCD ATPase subunit